MNESEEAKQRLQDLSADPNSDDPEVFFAERRERADFAAFDRIMARKGGVAPEGDDIP